MKADAFRIKNPGNSGCIVSIVQHAGRSAVQKKTGSQEYKPRLQTQREKQANFLTDIEQLRIPKVLAYDDTSFTMEHLQMYDAIEYFCVTSPRKLLNQVLILLRLIDRELDGSIETTIDSEIIVEKLSSIRNNVKPETWSKYYEIHANQIKESLPAQIRMPMGQCHGDLTFSNIMFSNHEDSIGLIDFLDSFLESPIVDIIKLRQDTRFGWTSKRYPRSHDRVKVAILMSWIDSMLQSKFNALIESDAFKIVEKVNYLRIAPYVANYSEHEFLSESLNTLKSA